MSAGASQHTCFRCGRTEAQVSEMFVAISDPSRAICGDCLNHLVFAENPDADDGSETAGRD
jgi:hypothetical protein